MVFYVLAETGNHLKLSWCSWQDGGEGPLAWPAPQGCGGICSPPHLQCVLAGFHTEIWPFPWFPRLCLCSENSLVACCLGLTSSPTLRKCRHSVQSPPSALPRRVRITVRKQADSKPEVGNKYFYCSKRKCYRGCFWSSATPGKKKKSKCYWEKQIL